MIKILKLFLKKCIKLLKNIFLKKLLRIVQKIKLQNMYNIIKLKKKVPFKLQVKDNIQISI